MGAPDPAACMLLALIPVRFCEPLTGLNLMTDITMVVSDATGSSQQVVVEDAQSTDIMGAEIGDTIEGAVCGQ